MSVTRDPVSHQFFYQQHLPISCTLTSQTFAWKSIRPDEFFFHGKYPIKQRSISETKKFRINIHRSGRLYQEKLFMMLKSKFFGTELKEFFFALRSLFDERWSKMKKRFFFQKIHLQTLFIVFHYHCRWCLTVEK